jgi:formylmethanofuran dehydrogenase subunit E
MSALEALLEKSAAQHSHLCPRQVLGARMGLYAGELLELDVPQSDKRLLTLVETDGCAVDGICAATNCSVGKRTLRVLDYGKLAATFVDTQTARTIRIAPRTSARSEAKKIAPDAIDAWNAMLLGYQRLTPQALFTWRAVELREPLAKILGQAGRRVVCAQCAEEIINGREIWRGAHAYCFACARRAYYRSVSACDAGFSSQRSRSRFSSLSSVLSGSSS